MTEIRKQFRKLFDKETSKCDTSRSSKELGKRAPAKTPSIRFGALISYPGSEAEISKTPSFSFFQYTKMSLVKL